MASYSLKAVIATLGGITLGGYHDDDAISYEPQSAWADSVVGADGVSIAFPTNDRRVRATITLQQTSPAFKRLFALWLADDAIIQAGGSMPTHAFLMINAATGEKSSGPANFIDRPMPNASKGPTARVFVIEIPNPDQLGAPLVSGTT
jgi:hypothetical protein